MRITIPPALLAGNDELQAKVSAKMFNKQVWSPEDFTHAHYQWLVDNDVEVDGTRLYSPELTEAKMSESVPTAWPGSETVDIEYAEQQYEPQQYDPEGNPLPLVPLPLEVISETPRQKTWFEYCVYFATANGYCIAYAGGPKNSAGNAPEATLTQAKTWANKFGGFLTRAEAYALRPTE